MGYDIRLYKDSPDAHIKKGATVDDLPRGGQYAIYSSEKKLDDDDLYLYITFNYSWYYYQTLPEGLRGLSSKTTTEVLPLLLDARDKILKIVETERSTGYVLSETWGKGSVYDDTDDNYWSVSAKNAVKALDSLIQLCDLAPGYTIRIFA